jgi:hypothetical protein
MAIKTGTTTVITDARQLTNITSASGVYDSFHPLAETITTVVNMDKPVMTVALSQNTSFTASNLATGRTSVLLLDTGSTGYTPSFSSAFKWPNDTEPSWSGTRYWQIGLTAWDNATIRVIATGWEGASGGGASPSVDLGSTAREFSRTNWWDESTNPHTAGTASMTFSTTGAVNYSYNTPTGTVAGMSFSNQTGTNTWGTAVTGSDYEIKYQFTTNHFGGSVTANPGNNVWLSLGSARTWTVSTGTNGGSSAEITGTVSIRNASTQVVLDTQTQVLEVSYYGAGVGNTCLTNNMLVQVQDKGLIRVYDLEVGDMIADDSEEMFTKIIDINKDHPREGYYTVDGWLEITNDHPMLINNEWTLPGDYQGNKTYHSENVNTVYIGTESGSFIVFNEDGDNITVSGDYAKGEDI